MSLIIDSKGIHHERKDRERSLDGRRQAEPGPNQHRVRGVDGLPYGFSGRFANDPIGTNPEEIPGAVHAACFTMAFSFACDRAGFATARADTQAQLRLSAQGGGFVIDRITLHQGAVVPGLDEARFQTIAATAMRECPLSQALANVPDIGLVASLGKSSPS